MSVKKINWDISNCLQRTQITIVMCVKPRKGRRKRAPHKHIHAVSSTWKYTIKCNLCTTTETLIKAMEVKLVKNCTYIVYHSRISLIEFINVGNTCIINTRYYTLISTNNNRKDKRRRIHVLSRWPHWCIIYKDLFGFEKI